MPTSAATTRGSSERACTSPSGGKRADSPPGGMATGISAHAWTRASPSRSASRNYLTEQARTRVKVAVDEAPKTGAFLSRPRLWVDLLSSQPQCFNLFGPSPRISRLLLAP